MLSKGKKFEFVVILFISGKKSHFITFPHIFFAYNSYFLVNNDKCSGKIAGYLYVGLSVILISAGFIKRKLTNYLDVVT
jgi:hypothetical protein